MDLDNFIYKLLEVQSGSGVWRDPRPTKPLVSQIITMARKKQKENALHRSSLEPEEKKQSISSMHDKFIKDSIKDTRKMRMRFKKSG